MREKRLERERTSWKRSSLNLEHEVAKFKKLVSMIFDAHCKIRSYRIQSLPAGSSRRERELV